MDLSLLRAEHTKTKIERIVFVSDEASDALKNLNAWKVKTHKPSANHDLFFQLKKTKSNFAIKPKSLYQGIAVDFAKLLEDAGFKGK